MPIEDSNQDESRRHSSRRRHGSHRRTPSDGKSSGEYQHRRSSEASSGRRHSSSRDGSSGRRREDAREEPKEPEKRHGRDIIGYRKHSSRHHTSSSSHSGHSLKSSHTSGHRKPEGVRHSVSKNSSKVRYRPEEKISNHLVLAILSTLLCCVPAGIVAICFASKVDSLATTGNTQLAQDYSDKARIWSIVSIMLGLCFMAFYFTASVLSALF